MEYENLKILKLEAENVKRLKVVEIVPQGDVVAIGGLNGQGKSSVLDSILYALAGARSMPDEPLRRGAKTGHIRLDLGDLHAPAAVLAS